MTDRIFPSLMSRTKRWNWFTPLRDGKILRNGETIILRNGEYRIPRLLRGQIFTVEGKGLSDLIAEKYFKFRDETFKRMESRANKRGDQLRKITEEYLPIRITGRLAKWTEKTR